MGCNQPRAQKTSQKGVFSSHRYRKSVSSSILEAFDDIRIRELLLFDRVVRLGTITAAAKELGLPKPTAGRWLALLEDRVGWPLLLRGARQVTPTERGRAFHQQIQPLLRSARALRAVARSEPSGGTLRVSVPVPFGRLLGGAVIAGFQRRLPGVRLEVLLQNQRVDLLADRIDLALRGGALPDSDLVARRLASIPLWLYAGVRFQDADVRPIPLIAAPGDEHLLQPSRPRMVPAAVVVDDRTAVRDALCAGAGAGVLPAFLGEPPRAAGELYRLDDEPLATTRLHAVFLPEQRDDPRLRTLIELIDAELHRWLDDG